MKEKSMEVYILRPLIMLFLLLMLPSVCFADGIVPLTNLFSKDTLMVAAIILLIIILLEALLLKHSIKQIPFRKHLFFSTVINIASSAAASVILPIIGREKAYFLLPSLTIVPLFIITLIVELPALKILYNRAVTWKDALRIDFKINVLSYIAVFIIQLVFIMGFFVFGGLMDKSIESKWTHKEILDQEKGYIYTTEGAEYVDYAGYSKYKIKKYNVKTKSWDSSSEPISNLGDWDIVGNNLAYVVTGKYTHEGNVVICRLPGAVPIRTISGSYGTVKLDPSGKYVVLLGNYHFISTGGICNKLSIYSVATGEKVFEYDYIYGNAIDWATDSTKILFASLRNKNLFGSEEYKAKSSGGLPYIYIYDIVNNSINEICQGNNPKWSTDGKRILFNKHRFDDKLYIYSLETKDEKLFLSGIYGAEYEWSPTNRNIIAAIPWAKPIPEQRRLVVINIDNPNLRVIIEPSVTGSFVWVE